MKKNELKTYCNEILTRTQNKSIQRMFYSRSENQDIVIDKIRKADLDSFYHSMLNKFEEYIKEE